MTEVQQLYILTDSNCEITASNTLLTPETEIYSLVTVTPNQNGDDVDMIQGKYVYGNAPGQEVMFVEDCANLGPIVICPGSTLLEKIKLNFLSKTQEQICEILQESIYPGDTEIQKYVNTFVGGIAMTFFTYKMAALDQSEINMPFNPFCPCSPLQDIELTDLTNSLFNYYSYMIAVMKCLPICPIGKLWLLEVYKTWTVWGADCFEDGPCYHNDVAIYCTIQGFSCYFYETVQKICDKIDDFEELVKKAIEEICSKLEEALQKIDEKCQEFEEKFEKALCTITCTGMMIVKMIKQLWCQCKSDIEYTCNECIEKIEEKCNECHEQLTTEHKNYLSSLDAKHHKLHDDMVGGHDNLVRSIKNEHKKILEKIAKHSETVENQHLTYISELERHHSNLQDSLRKDHVKHGNNLKKLHKELADSLAGPLGKRDRKTMDSIIKQFLNSEKFASIVDKTIENRITGMKERDLPHKMQNTDKKRRTIGQLEARLEKLEKDNERLVKIINNLVNTRENISFEVIEQNQ